MFSISKDTLNRDNLIAQLSNDKAGALVVFEGWVRDHNEGKSVSSLEYQIYHALALKEGERILQEAKEKFNLHNVMTVHREGHLNLGEMAIWIGATSSHRDDAFKATRYVIDEIKHRLPVWKKEHYVSGKKEWVFCRHHHHHVHFEETDYYQKQSWLIRKS
jgi:molybdopterin synthase catalytic subunit